MMRPINDLDRAAFATHYDLSEEDYWLNQLSGDLVKSSFPYDYKRTGGNQYCGDFLKFKFTGELFSKLMKLSSGSAPRLHMILIAGLIVLLSKYSSNKDILVGTSIYKQEVEAEFVNTILVLRNQLKDNMTFKELLLQVRETIIEADKNQNFSVEILIQELNIPFSKDDNFPLFDVALLLENIQKKDYVKYIKTDVLFSFLKKKDYLEGVVEYNSLLYKKETIERIISHLTHLLQEALSDVDLKVFAVDILLEKEKNQLLYDFNNTGTEYPKDKTIPGLFEAQVEKTPHNTAIVYKDILLTYKELKERSNRLVRFLTSTGVKPGTIVGIMAEHSIEIVVGILGVLKAGAAYLPIDLTNPEDRIAFILQDSNTDVLLIQKHISGKHKDFLQNLSLKNIISINDKNIYSEKPAILTHNSSPMDAAYIIYTSGTTGKPKGVKITQQALVNYTWWAARNYVKGEPVDFPLYTSISFDLTVTSIFTPLITGNAVVIYDSKDKEPLIEKIIDDDRVAVVKLTPSHLKLIRDRNVYQFRAAKKPGIRCFIVGGEALDTDLAKDTYENFNGNIEIYNEYGPTEATVGCMLYKFNPEGGHMKSVPIGFAADNTQIYLLDSHQKPVPVGVIGEIYVSGAGVAVGYINRVELTAEKFVPNLFVPGTGTRMYRTGDLARRLADGNIVYLGRSDHQVKVRGYRIEPGEIEAQILSYPLIRDVVVITREDKSGEKQLVAYVEPTLAQQDKQEKVEEELEKGLRQYLKEKLPDYMMPSHVVQLEKIPLTPNSKIDRQALPTPEVKTTAEYVAPGNDIEKELVGIWSDLLGIEKDIISINANFFELGGHSLMATKLISQIHKVFDVTVPLGSVFNTPTIKDLSEHIKKIPGDEYVPIEKAKEKEYYGLSSAQKRLYVLYQMEPASINYNVPIVVTLVKKTNRDRIKEAFRKLIARHETLRTSFQEIEGEPVQKIHNDVEFDIEYYDLSGSSKNQGNENCEKTSVDDLRVETRAKKLVEMFARPFDLSKAPLIRVGLIKTPEQEHILMVDMHHIITDGVSQQIVINDFIMIYNGAQPPPLKYQYKDCTEWQNRLLNSKKLEKQKNYWLKKFEGEIPILNLPIDYPRPDSYLSKGDRVPFQIDKDLVGKIKRILLETDTSLYMFLLGVYDILISLYTGQEDIVVGSPITGRTHVDLENIIGIFVNMLAMRNYPQKNKNFKEFLSEIKKNCIDSFENQDYQFDELVKELGIKRSLSRKPLVETVFTLHNESERPDKEKKSHIKDLEIKPYRYKNHTSMFDLTLDAIEGDDLIFIWITYSTGLFKTETIEKMKKHYIEILKQVVDNIEIRLGEITISYNLAASKSYKLREDKGNFEF